MADFVRQGQFVKENIQVTDGGMKVHRFHRITADHMDAIEIVRKFDQIRTLFAGTGNLLAKIKIVIIGR